MLEQSFNAVLRHCAVCPAELPKIWLACFREMQQVVVMAGFVDGYMNHFLLPITYGKVKYIGNLHTKI